MANSILEPKKLFVVKTVHSFIYITIVAAIFYILYAGITKTHNHLLYTSLGIVIAECIVFVGNGMRCPLTALAKKYGATKGHGGDSLFPERYTRYTLGIFGTVLLIGVLLLTLDYLNLR